MLAPLPALRRLAPALLLPYVLGLPAAAAGRLMIVLPPEPIVWTLLIVSTAIAVGFICAAADVPANIRAVFAFWRGR